MSITTVGGRASLYFPIHSIIGYSGLSPLPKHFACLFELRYDKLSKIFKCLCGSARNYLRHLVSRPGKILKIQMYNLTIIPCRLNTTRTQPA